MVEGNLFDPCLLCMTKADKKRKLLVATSLDVLDQYENLDKRTAKLSRESHHLVRAFHLHRAVLKIGTNKLAG